MLLCLFNYPTSNLPVLRAAHGPWFGMYLYAVMLQISVTLTKLL